MVVAVGEGIGMVVAVWVVEGCLCGCDVAVAFLQQLLVLLRLH